ncbi:MAG: 6-phosphogluconolactonase [Actinomycetota bacterium]
MPFEVLTLEGDYSTEAAAHIAGAFTGGGSLVLTGGRVAKNIYPHLAGRRADWTGVQVAYSDDRCVPPDHAESNYGMTKRLFLDAAEGVTVHRVRGELEPERAAAMYSDAMKPLVEHGFDLLLLGMGADAHIGAMFPGSPALGATAPAMAVDRPDGMKGVTLTPPAMLSARKIILVVTGEEKAPTIRRAVQGTEPPEGCPVRLLAGHPDVTFLLDPAAASHL